MAWFFKKREVLDLSERYRKQQERLKELKQEAVQESSSSSESSPMGFGIFGMSSTTTATAEDSSDSGFSETPDEKRRKLAKRLMDITDKLEDLSNQIYHIQQRLEVLEKKNNPSSFGVFN